jgi:4-coumarate--CoA ligase
VHQLCCDLILIIDMYRPNVMKGYWRNEAATSQTIDRDGFLHTGDVAYVDPDGNFYVVDRIKELIKVKGLQVAPAELEGLLLQHPAIASAAVIPIPDERSGELPRAYVVLKENYQGKVSENDVKDFVKKQVAPPKQLNGGVVFTSLIPMAPSGKILRRQLRELAKKELSK